MSSDVDLGTHEAAENSLREVDGLATPTLPFSDTVRARRSIRAFTGEPVPDEQIRELLYEAALSPSNCNTQPWAVHVVQGQALRELSVVLTDAWDRGEQSLDFFFDVRAYEGELQERRFEHGEILHGAQGTRRDDVEGRTRNARRNLEFFGAPHALFLFMPQVGDGVRVAADVGMFAQTFLLGLGARGLGGVPQTTLGMYASQVRGFLGIPEEQRLLFGISFGHIDRSAPVNTARTPRSSDFVVVHGDSGEFGDPGRLRDR